MMLNEPKRLSAKTGPMADAPKPVKISEAPPVNITDGVDSVEYIRAGYAPEPIKPLTPRQRAIIRAYFASGCCTTRAARGLGISVTRVREVKAFPAAKVYLAELEADCAHTVVLARAAQILAPTLRP